MRWGIATVEFLGASKVGQLAHAGKVDENIWALDVAVQDLVRVEVLEPLQNLPAVTTHDCQRGGTASGGRTDARRRAGRAPAAGPARISPLSLNLPYLPSMPLMLPPGTSSRKMTSSLSSRSVPMYRTMFGCESLRMTSTSFSISACAARDRSSSPGRSGTTLAAQMCPSSLRHSNTRPYPPSPSSDPRVHGIARVARRRARKPM